MSRRLSFTTEFFIVGRLLVQHVSALITAINWKSTSRKNNRVQASDREYNKTSFFTSNVQIKVHSFQH